MAVYPTQGEHWWHRLQPLRIPPGWELVFYKLEALEADGLKEDDDAWLFHFVEDILYMCSKRSRRKNKRTEEQTVSIDLGWYPEGEPKGAYTLAAVLNENWEEPLLEFSARSTREVVETMEFWLFQYFSNPYEFIDEATFRKAHPDKK